MSREPFYEGTSQVLEDAQRLGPCNVIRDELGDNVVDYRRLPIYIACEQESGLSGLERASVWASANEIHEF